jgi:hypothetical protein
MQPNGLGRASAETIVNMPPDGNFRPFAVGDFDRNGTPDIIRRNLSTGQTDVTFLDGAYYSRASLFTGDIATVTGSWEIIGSADWDRDGKTDIAWYNYTTGEIQIWLMNGITRREAWSVDAVVGNVVSGDVAGTNDPNNFVVFAGDFDGNGIPDFLLHNFGTGFNQVWFMGAGGHRTGFSSLQDQFTDLNTVTDSQYRLRAVTDFNGDGKPDLLWKKSDTGRLQIWFMNGTMRQGAGDVTDPALAIPDFYMGWTLVTAY